jgi:uncharacterized protein (DUF2141 family)
MSRFLLACLVALAGAVVFGPGVARAARCPAPPAAAYPPTDGARDAHAQGALFRRVAVPGFTDRRQDTAGIAVEDFNDDARADLFAIYNDGSMRMLLGRGCLRFSDHRFELVDSPYGYDNPPGGAAIANWVDLNGDGHLDAFITHNTDGANTTQRSATPSAGNSLLLSQGAFDRFTEAGPRLGVTNETAYNRASSIADVDGDGHLDIAVGADQIGRPQFGGGSVQRLYVWRPARRRYEDIGGSRRAPGFGGPLTCDPRKDKASPGILLRDLDGDARPDLVQGYHNDMLLASQTSGECVTGERTFGLFAWRNRSRKARPRLGAVPHPRAGLGGPGRMRYDSARGDYDVVSHGYGLPYVFAADAFNSGRLDLIAVGPTDPEFHVNSDMIAGKFFRNLGDLRFRDQTARRGLAALNWTVGRWARFYGVAIHEPSPLMQLACPVSNRRPTCMSLPLRDHQPYASTVAWGDFDNDGCLDFVLADRHEDPTNLDGLRNSLFRNRCNGTFEPVTTQVSGLDTNSISVEVADLDGDGLLDLVAGAQPTNSYPISNPPLPDDRYLDKVFLNTGGRGARANHWVELDLTGRPQRRLIGTQLTLTGLGPGGRSRFLGRRDYVTSDSYKSGRWPRVHWGLGKQRRARVALRLPSGERMRLALPCVDRRVVIDVRRGRVRGCVS